MRFLRLPYHYLPTSLLWKHYRYSHGLLNIIHDIHNDIPNEGWWRPYVSAYMLHPIFVYWVYVKAKRRLKVIIPKDHPQRGVVDRNNLSDGVMKMGSRPLSDFIPPKDADLAADTVWLLDYEGDKEGMNLPYNYIELARQHYGDEVNERSQQGVARSHGAHRDSDRDWYLS